MGLPTRVYEKGAIRVTFRRLSRYSILNRNLYMQAMRTAYPEADYLSPYQDALIEERRAKNAILATASGNAHDLIDQAENRSVPESERTKFETASLLSKAIEGVAGLLAYVVGPWSGLPYPFPDPTDVQATKTILDWYLSDEPDMLELWDEWATLCTELQGPMTPVAQRPKEALTAEQVADPLSVANAQNLGDG